MGITISGIMVLMIIAKSDEWVGDCNSIISTISKPLNSLVEWYRNTKNFQILFN